MIALRGDVMKIIHMWPLLLALVLCGCNWSETVERIIPETARPVMAETLDVLERKESEALLDLFHPQLDRAQGRTAMPSVLVFVPDEGTATRHLLSAHSQNNTVLGGESTRTVRAVYRLDWPEESLLVTVELRHHETAQWTIWNLNLQPTPTQSGFPALSEMEPRQLTFVVAALACVAFILFTLVASFRTRRLKRRILWALFIVSAFPVFAMNLDTGAFWMAAPGVQSGPEGFSVQLFAIRFFGAAVEQVSGSWVVEVAVPIGALFFWYRMVRGGPTRKPPKTKPATPAQNVTEKAAPPA